MKKKLMARKVIVAVVLLILLFGAFGLSVFATSVGNETDIIVTETNDTAALFNESDGERLCLEYDDYTVPNSVIVFPFYISTERVIEEITHTEVGFSFISSQISGDYIYVTVHHIDETEKPELDLTVSFSDGTAMTAFARGYVLDDKLYISRNSHDDCYEKYVYDLLLNGEIDQQKYDELRNTYYINCVTVTTSVNVDINASVNFGQNEVQSTNSDTATINGQVTWIDENGVVHPAQFVTIQHVYRLTFGGMEFIQDLQTDENGYYSFVTSNESMYSRMICVTAGNENVILKTSTGAVYGAVFPYTIDGNELVVDISFDCRTSDLGKAFCAANAAILGHRYAETMNSGSSVGQLNIEPVTIMYPHNEEGDNCFYRYNLRTIYIAGDQTYCFVDDAVIRAYSSWDVILHEYGHHLQYLMGIIDSPGGTHYFEQNCIDLDSDVNASFSNENKIKHLGVKLAWGEAWPTVYSIMAQQYCSNLVSNIFSVGDTSYTAYNGVDFNLETEIIRLGEGNETSIIYVLYDLYDSTTMDESHDQIAWGHQQFWDATKSSQAKTFWEFTQYLYNNNLVDENNYGKLLGRAGMVPDQESYNFVGNTGIDGVAPIMSFNIGDGSEKRPVDVFVLEIANWETGEIIKTINLTTDDVGEGEERQYNLPLSIWNEVLEAGSDFIKWRVSVGQSDSQSNNESLRYPTGIYYSAWSDPNYLKLKIIAENEVVVDDISTSEDYAIYKFVTPRVDDYCIRTSSISLNNTNVKGTLYLTLIDAINETNPLRTSSGISTLMTPYLSANRSIYIRIEGVNSSTGYYYLSINHQCTYLDYIIKNIDNPNYHRKTCKVCGVVSNEEHMFVMYTESASVCDQCRYLKSGMISYSIRPFELSAIVEDKKRLWLNNLVQTRGDL